MKNLSGRLNDELLERHIRLLGALALAAFEAGDLERARKLDAAFKASIQCRSDAQVERMERKMGLR